MMTLYLSFSFESFYNPVLSHRMNSTLFDYFAAVWFFLAVLSGLVWLTRRRYANSLERLIGCPVYGRISGRCLQLGGRATGTLNRLSHGYTWTNPEHLLLYSIMLTATMALSSLAAPWMYPGNVPGYRFLVMGSTPPIADAFVLSELRIQLGVAIVFVLSCFAASLIALWVRGEVIDLVWKGLASIGIVVVTLVGNLFFHCGMLELGVDTFGFWFGFGGPTSLSPAKPLNLKDLGPLSQSDPAYGLVIFSLLCVLLTICASFAKSLPEQLVSARGELPTCSATTLVSEGPSSTQDAAN